MQQLIILLLKSIACAGILSVYYLLFLRNKKLHNFNRFYLLATTVFSLVVPFLEFKSYVLTPVSQSGIVLLDAINMDKEYELITPGTTSMLTTDTIAQYAYISISFFLLIMLLARIAWIFRLKMKGTVEQKNGYAFILTESAQAPFSFLNNLFWKKDIDTGRASSQQIITHELCHIHQQHTLDKLYMQLVIIAAWANPIFWFIRKELAMQHEFIADDAAINGNDTDAFARMILQARYTNLSPDIIHPFFHSSIKRRLMMLNQTKNTRFSYLRRAMLLPLAACVLLLLSFRISTSGVKRANKTISVIFDAGHGGKDNGATGINGLKEKDLNLRICNKLAALAPEYNINARLTRNDDSYPTLEERVAQSNQQNPDLFISIHVNKSTPEEPVNNYEVVFAGRNKFPEQSRALGSAITARLKSINLEPVFAQHGLHVVNENNRPALLIECGDINNKDNMSMIANEQSLEKFCRQILSGIADYQNSKK